MAPKRAACRSARGSCSRKTAQFVSTPGRRTLWSACPFYVGARSNDNLDQRPRIVGTFEKRPYPAAACQSAGLVDSRT